MCSFVLGNINIAIRRELCVMCRHAWGGPWLTWCSPWASTTRSPWRWTPSMCPFQRALPHHSRNPRCSAPDSWRPENSAPFNRNRVMKWVIRYVSLVPGAEGFNMFQSRSVRPTSGIKWPWNQTLIFKYFKWFHPPLHAPKIVWTCDILAQANCGCSPQTQQRGS